MESVMEQVLVPVMESVMEQALEPAFRHNTGIQIDMVHMYPYQSYYLVLVRQNRTHPDHMFQVQCPHMDSDIDPGNTHICRLDNPLPIHTESSYTDH